MRPDASARAGDNGTVPKITAPTVAAHRVAQRAALVRAAGEVAVERGAAGVVPRAVCERAGLSRSSFYDYFASRDELLVTIAVEAFEAWARDLAAALGGVAGGEPRLRAYVTATMRMTTDGRHDLAGVLTLADLPADRVEEVMALHDTLVMPLLDLLRGLDLAEPERWLTLAQSVISAGIAQVHRGVDAEAVAEDVCTLLLDGLPR